MLYLLCLLTHFRYAQDAPCSPCGRQLASFAIPLHSKMLLAALAGANSHLSLSPSTLRCSLSAFFCYTLHHLPLLTRVTLCRPPGRTYLFVIFGVGVGGGVGSISFISRLFTYGHYSSKGGYAGLITRMDGRPISFSFSFQKSKSITVPGSGRLINILSV